VNSKPRHSIITRGAKPPLLSAEYGVGAALSKVAECSRLQFAHFHTKLAMAFFPDMRERSFYTRYIVSDYSGNLFMVYADNRSRTYCAIDCNEVRMRFPTVPTLDLMK